MEDIKSDEEGDKDKKAAKEKEDEGNMGVKVGTMTKVDEDQYCKMVQDEEYKLRVMVIKK